MQGPRGHGALPGGQGVELGPFLGVQTRDQTGSVPSAAWDAFAGGSRGASCGPRRIRTCRTPCVPRGIRRVRGPRAACVAGAPRAASDAARSPNARWHRRSARTPAAAPARSRNRSPWVGTSVGGAGGGVRWVRAEAGCGTALDPVRHHSHSGLAWQSGGGGRVPPRRGLAVSRATDLLIDQALGDVGVQPVDAQELILAQDGDPLRVVGAGFPLGEGLQVLVRPRSHPWRTPPSTCGGSPAPGGAPPGAGGRWWSHGT
jgi:hypothetical protein